MKYLDPKVNIEKIEVQFEENQSDEKYEDFINYWGKLIPIVKIQDEIFNIGNIISFEYHVEINSQSKFILKIKDEFKRFQANYKDDEKITGIIFLGNKIWYHKFNILITDIMPFGEDITIFGYIYNEKLYNSVQKSYNNIPLLDVLKDICEQTDLGLYSLSNEKLSEKIPLILNTNKKYSDIINDVITKYTNNNFWCIDQYYMLHVQNYDSLIKKEVDKYTIKNGKQTEATDIVITNYIKPDETELEDDEKKFTCYDLKINNNIGYNSLKTSANYMLNDETIASHEKIGFSTNSANTFSRFLNNTKPFYKEIFEKDITGNSFEIMLKTPIYEIFPFMVVNMEIYNFSNDKEIRQYILNEEQSGKKIVIGYVMTYNNPNFQPEILGYRDRNEIVQKIKLI